MVDHSQYYTDLNSVYNPNGGSGPVNGSMVGKGYTPDDIASMQGGGAGFDPIAQSLASAKADGTLTPQAVQAAFKQFQYQYDPGYLQSSGWGKVMQDYLANPTAPIPMSAGNYKMAGGDPGGGSQSSLGNFSTAPANMTGMGTSLAQLSGKGAPPLNTTGGKGAPGVAPTGAPPGKGYGPLGTVNGVPSGPAPSGPPPGKGYGPGGTVSTAPPGPPPTGVHAPGPTDTGGVSPPTGGVGTLPGGVNGGGSVGGGPITTPGAGGGGYAPPANSTSLADLAKGTDPNLLKLDVNKFMNPFTDAMIKRSGDLISSSGAARGQLQSGNMLTELNNNAASIYGQQYNNAEQAAMADRATQLGQANTDRNVLLDATGADRTYNTQTGQWEKTFARNNAVDDRNFDYSKDVNNRDFAYNAANTDRTYNTNLAQWNANFGRSNAVSDRDFNYQTQHDLASMGMQGANGTSALSTALAQLLSGNGLAAAQAQGAGTIGGANNINSIITNLISQYMNGQVLNRLPVTNNNDTAYPVQANRRGG